MPLTDWLPMRFDVEFWGGLALGVTVGVVVMIVVLS